MSMEWIRKTYGVPAKRGGRVEYTGGKTPEQGTITAARGGYLRIRLDGMEYTHPLPFHPTYELRYLDAPPPPSRRARVSDTPSAALEASHE